MLSPIAVKMFKLMPESMVVFFGKKVMYGYIKKYADLNIEGHEKIKNIKKPKIFICNHLSNSDGLVLSKVLKDDFDPYFIAGAKLSDDHITKIGTEIVKNIKVKPNSADKEAITTMVKALKNGENIMIFPEGTRSRTGAMIEGKKGILLLARLTKAVIIPIGMTGTEKLLPIDDSHDMGKETWHHSKVTIKIGDSVSISKREKDEEKHAYEDRCLTEIMKSIACLLPENYRGVYK